MSQIQRRRADDAIGSLAYQRPTSATAERCEIPTELIGQFCTFIATTTDAFIRFGDETVDVAIAADSTRTSEALTAAATTAQLVIPAGQERRRRIRSGVTHLAHVSTGAGVLRFGLSQGAFGTSTG